MFHIPCVSKKFFSIKGEITFLIFWEGNTKRGKFSKRSDKPRMKNVFLKTNDQVISSQKTLKHNCITFKPETFDLEEFNI